MLFEGWDTLLRTLTVGVASYLSLIAILRISGKRTLSKMNAFDFVVTVALGSTLATILLSPEVALAEGVLALGLLVGLQYVVATLSSRSQTVTRLVKSDPALLVHRGRILPEAVDRERVSEVELLQAARQHGLGSLEEAAAIVLETDGTFSVLREVGASESSTRNVHRPEEDC